MAQKRWLAAGAALAIVLAALIRTCLTQTSKQAPKQTPITAIKIVPGEVVVGPDAPPTTFELEARVATEEGSIGETQGYGPLHWKSDQPWLTVASHAGFRATLRVPAGAAPAGPALVTVKVGDLTSPPAKISIAPATLGGQDLVTASYSAGKPPDAVVVNGIRTAGGPCTKSLSAFVARDSLGNLVGPCAGWGAAVLAADHSLAFTPPRWTPAQDLVAVGTMQKPPLTLPVALHVMVDSSLSPANLKRFQEEVRKQAQADISLANVILAQARAGIQLVPRSPIPASEGVSVDDCLDGDTKTAANDVATLLNVYYVNWLGSHGIRGIACAWHTARPQDVIYVAWDLHAPETLVHELGHTLGLTLPGQGHSNILPGFDPTNVMTDGLYDTDPVGRHRLTVGQVFRMNADSASWLNWATDVSKHPVRDPAAPRLACQCGAADPAAGLCPPLVADVAPQSGATGTAHDGDCFDQLWLRNLRNAEGEQPVALLAGRRWRSPPTTCSTDLPGLTEKSQATYIRIANLTRPGTCPSWAAIFFRKHGVLYLPLSEPGVSWSQAADPPLPVDNHMPALVRIAVNVEYPAAQVAGVMQDVGYASQTFGQKNRTGINLKFTLTASTTCSTAPPALRSIGVCYVQSGTSEGSLVGPGRIHVTIGKHATTTLAHLIGRALGLEELSSSDPAFPQNIMLPRADRGEKLTLGQVFRINVFLNPSLAPCSTDPKSCPSLAADVMP